MYEKGDREEEQWVTMDEEGNVPHYEFQSGWGKFLEAIPISQVQQLENELSKYSNLYLQVNLYKILQTY